MNRISMLGLCVVLACAGTVSAQHTSHQVADQPALAPDQQLVAACVQSQKQAREIAAQMNRRLQAARQTNSATEMRAAIDDLLAGLTDLETALRACDPLKGSAVAPAEVPTDDIDPVCGMKVDPGSSPTADHEGRTYYFCSESDRQRFLKNPSTYIKKEGGGPAAPGQ